MSQQVDWRFWSKVDVGDCWLWTASVTPKGYGKFSVTRSDWRLAHRVAWEILVGPIPEGLTLDHLCRVANCVNPDHLEPVTKAENNQRSPWGLTACVASQAGRNPLRPRPRVHRGQHGLAGRRISPVPPVPA